jgi:hypothetical protein
MNVGSKDLVDCWEDDIYFIYIHNIQ